MSDTDSLLRAPATQHASSQYASWLRDQLLELRQVVAEQGREIAGLKRLVNSVAHYESPHERTFALHKADVLAVASFPDGVRVASGSVDANSHIIVWDLDKNFEVARLKEHKGAVYSLAVTRDGGYLLSASADGSIRVYETKDYTCIHTLTGIHKDTIRSLAVPPDNSIFISSSWDGTIAIWSLDTFAPLHAFLAHTDEVRAIDFLSDDLFISSGADGFIKVWSVRRITPATAPEAKGGSAFAPVEEYMTSLQAPESKVSVERKSLHALHVAPLQRLLFSTSSDPRAVDVYSISEGGELSLLSSIHTGHDGHIHAIQLIPKQLSIAKPTEEGVSATEQKESEESDGVSRLRKLVTNNFLTTGGSDGTLRFFRLKPSVEKITWECVQVLQAHENAILSISVVPAAEDEKPRFVTASKDTKVKIWSIKRLLNLLPSAVLAGKAGAGQVSVTSDNGQGYSSSVPPYIGE